MQMPRGSCQLFLQTDHVNASTIQQDLKYHNITLPEAMDMAQNPSLWRMCST